MHSPALLRAPSAPQPSPWLPHPLSGQLATCLLLGDLLLATDRAALPIRSSGSLYTTHNCVSVSLTSHLPAPQVNESLGNAHTGTSLSQVSVLATQGDPCDGDSDSDTATSGLTRPSVPGVVADVADDVAAEQVLRRGGQGEGEREKIRAVVSVEEREGKERSGRGVSGEKKKLSKKEGGGGPLGVFKGLLGMGRGLSPVMKQVSSLKPPP